MRNPFKRKQQFVPERECVPAFVFNGDDLVEVGFTEWETTADGAWRMAEGTKMDLDSPADHVIFETPVGCFESRLDVEPGMFGMRPGSHPEGRNAELTVCRRTQAARACLLADARENLS